MGVYQDIVKVDISLNVESTSRQGFGRPIFVSSNRYFEERVRAYNSITGVEDDIPVGSPTHKAMLAYFSQTPHADIVYVGRRESDVIIKPSATATASTSYSFTLEVNDGDSLDITYTTGATPTLATFEEDIAAGFKAAIEADLDIINHITVALDGTGVDQGIRINATLSTDWFIVNKLVRLSETYASSETASQVLEAIEDENSDWYFMTAEDHTPTFVLEMAESIEARTKMYFVSSQDVAILTPLADPAVDLFGQLKELEYQRTATFFHHTADTTFPECAYVGHNAPYDAGAVNWANLQLNGVSVSSDPTTGRNLTVTQRGYLTARNANFTESVGGVTITREGKVVKGNTLYIDLIRGTDDLTVQMTGDLRDLLINQKGGKIPYTNRGIALVANTMSSTLQQFVNRDFLVGYRVNVPDIRDIAITNIQNRVLKDVTFEGLLSGAISVIQIQGTLSFDQSIVS